ncbi:hypothetical protein GGQ57_004779 [Parabacteroides faecis]|uniref:Uncharacterized protein n=1 Tax=Parabacteroides faecis TaxID=1217282 RepID=A0ABR6KTK8_9BACT|nr:hypothetical protein [Parabacteroides faecis]
MVIRCNLIAGLFTLGFTRRVLTYLRSCRTMVFEGLIITNIFLMLKGEARIRGIYVKKARFFAVV